MEERRVLQIFGGLLLLVWECAVLETAYWEVEMQKGCFLGPEAEEWV